MLVDEVGVLVVAVEDGRALLGGDGCPGDVVSTGELSTPLVEVELESLCNSPSFSAWEMRGHCFYSHWN